ncbi:MAG: hypothetical protein LQ350_005043 [Teloschistes chrysophthalmus]|nr:MAG: hypothetical protein LQ350_005043 [Niorma chrysophthalma]
MSKTSVPAPIIPPRTSARTPKQQRRRRHSSSPEKIPSSSAAKRSPNHVTVKPASSEVISSLISSLSAISTLDHSHSGSSTDIHDLDSSPAWPDSNKTDFLSPITPSSPISPAQIAFGMEHGSSGRLYVSPRGTSLRSSYSYQDIRPRSRLRIGEVNDETCSIGQLSIEPGRGRSSPRPVSVRTDHGKSTKTGMGIRNSEEKLRNDSGTTSQPHGEEVVDQLSDMVSKSPQRSSLHSGTAAGRRSNDSTASVVVGSGHVVPSRESSLRHSFSGSSSHRKSRSCRSADFNIDGKRSSIAEHGAPPDSDSTQDVPFDSPATDVTRRIKELKDQKRLRDISLTVTTPDLMPPSPSASRAPSPLRLPQSPPSPLTVDTKALNKVANDSSNEKSGDTSAPSPSVGQRIDRKSKRNSIGAKPFAVKPFSAVRPAEPNRTQSTPIQRSNSKLLRRLSRPLSPTTVEKLEKHRRTISHPISEPRSPLDPPQRIDPIDEAVDDYLSSPRLSQKTTDPETGRVISFSEVGDPEGSVVFCCVGMGLTRYITCFYDDLAKTLKLRLITPDRPGVGGSEVHADDLDTPLGWPDDVLAICQKLKLTKFSLLAHSAGAIYALATALRMPQHIRGRIHLLAPWIPPSQMSGIGTQQESLPVSALPLTQRFLQSLPTTFLKAANSNYLRTTSASITTSLPKSPRRSKQKVSNADGQAPRGLSKAPTRNGSLQIPKTRSSIVRQDSGSKEVEPSDDSDSSPSFTKPSLIPEKGRDSTYDDRLTAAIWDASTTAANPAVDLLVCLERKQPIGFRYVDITRSVIIHHGSKDTRVPVENAKWLGKTMRKCEVRVLDGEGHGLMASAAVMGNVLMEMAKEWEDWNRVVQGKMGGARRRFSP